MLRALRHAPAARAFAARRALASPAILTWGDGTDGQLGHYPFSTSGLMKQYLELSPRELEGLPALRDVACGQNHTLAVDDGGRVWSWGKSDYGKCGHGDDKDCPEPKIIEALAGVDVAAVACGETHSLAVDSDGRAYSWGWGGSWISGGGQLGHGDRDHRYAPELIAGALESATIASVSAGEAHTVFLTDDGEVWTCGAGEHGRNGNGGSSDVLAPEPVLALDDTEVVEARAGSAFTVARDAAGLVHVWGRNDQGQLGLGGGLAMDVYALEDLPRVVEVADDAPLLATSIAVGHSHVAVITPEGRLLQWGAKLALEPAEHVFVTDDGAPVPKPARVFCGGGYTVVLDEAGAAYTFGQGGSRCLGHGDKKREPHPKAVAALADFEIERVACGFRHVAALGGWK
mmetsp:Transcript_19224/g.59166  ORF Transcript_19224/g.59166 Transcript_19224/m.59166 type:complete len:402 (-) Transcript_19224:32-1237(-)